MIASGCAERPKSTSLCSRPRHRCDKHSRLDVTARACRMLPETLRAGDATSPGPLIPSEVKTSTSLSLWNLGRLYKLSPRRISWIISPPFPPFRLYPLPTALSAFPPCFLPPVLSFDYSPRLLLPTLCFFFFLYSRYSREILRPVIYHDNQTIYTNPNEAATGADVKGVERLCRVETGEEVSRALVTVPLPLIRHDMGFSDQTAGVGSRYAGVWGRPPRQ